MQRSGEVPLGPIPSTPDLRKEGAPCLPVYLCLPEVLPQPSCVLACVLFLALLDSLGSPVFPCPALRSAFQGAWCLEWVVGAAPDAGRPREAQSWVRDVHTPLLGACGLRSSLASRPRAHMDASCPSRVLLSPYSFVES